MNPEQQGGFGRVVPLPNEIEEARKKALENREDPDEAERKLMEKFAEANQRLREANRGSYR